MSSGESSDSSWSSSPTGSSEVTDFVYLTFLGIVLDTVLTLGYLLCDALLTELASSQSSSGYYGNAASELAQAKWFFETALTGNLAFEVGLYKAMYDECVSASGQSA